MSHLLAASAVTGTVAVVPFVLATVIFGVGSLISVSRRDVTWIDAVLMVGFGVLIGSTTLGLLIHSGLDRLGSH